MGVAVSIPSKPNTKSGPSRTAFYYLFSFYKILFVNGFISEFFLLFFHFETVFFVEHHFEFGEFVLQLLQSFFIINAIIPVFCYHEVTSY